MAQLTIHEPSEIAAEVARVIQGMGLTANPEWVDASELARRLGISKQQVEDLAAHGTIPHKNLAMPGSSKRVLRFSVAAVEKWFLESK